MDAPRRRAIRRRAARSRRAAQIAAVLARHGLGSLTRAAGMRRRARHDEAPERPLTAERYAGAASDLGVVFVRLAHALSWRVDLFSAPERRVLAAAASEAPVIDVDTVEDALAEQLGGDARHRLSVEELGAVGPTTVCGVGSMADGGAVTVVIRHPGLAAAIERDLDILRSASRLVARRWALAARLDLAAELEQFGAQLEREVDLEVVAAVLDALATLGEKGPEVEWELTSPGVLTMRVGPDPTAAGLLRLWRQEGIVVLDPGAVGHDTFRSIVVSAAGVERFAALAAAVHRAGADEVVDLLVTAATHGAGLATARLRGAVDRILAQPDRLGARLEAVVGAAGEAMLTLDSEISTMIAAVEALEAFDHDLTDETIVHTLIGLRPAQDRSSRDEHVARWRPPVRRPFERSGRTVGLALSGGAVRGAAHAGAIEVLAAAGLRPDFIAGTSVGALVGAVLAAGMAPDELARVVANMRWSTVARPVPSRLGLFDTNPMEAFIEATIGPLEFDDLLCPLAVVTCDLLTGEQVVIDRGPVATAVRASTALPGIFPPVEHEGRLLIDGGVVDNLPVDVVRALGADYVVAVDVSPPITDGRRPRGMLEVILMASDIMTVAQRRTRSVADITIQADVAQYGGWSIAEVPEIYERGRAAAESVLDDLRRDLGI